MSKKPNRKPTPSSPPWFFKALEYMAIIQTRVGLVGFIVIVLTFIVLTFPSEQQEQEIVDMWILFKNEGHQTCVLLGIVVLFLLAGQQMHYTNVNRKNEARMKEITAEKTRLQEQLLGKSLGSSDLEH